MDIKEAVRTALNYVANLYGEASGEEIHHLGLEEIERDAETGEWLVTVGFSRKWDLPEPSRLSPPFDELVGPRRPRRRYKVVHIEDESGEVTALRDRELTAA